MHIAEGQVGILIVVLGRSERNQVVLHLYDQLVELLIFLTEAKKLLAGLAKIFCRRCEWMNFSPQDKISSSLF